MKQKIIGALTATAILLAGQASAGTVTGKINRIFVSGLNNLPFRIVLSVPTPAECNGEIYVDGASNNYQVYVSALMLAYSLNKEVDIIYNVGTNGFCSISEFLVK